MAAPNIVNVATITGITTYHAGTATVGASAGVTTVVINAASSGKVLKINALTAASIGATTGVTLNYYDTAGRHTAAASTVSMGTTISCTAKCFAVAAIALAACSRLTQVLIGCRPPD